MAVPVKRQEKVNVLHQAEGEAEGSRNRLSSCPSQKEPCSLDNRRKEAPKEYPRIGWSNPGR